jgi:hypothetical protein
MLHKKAKSYLNAVLDQEGPAQTSWCSKWAVHCKASRPRRAQALPLQASPLEFCGCGQRHWQGSFEMASDTVQCLVEALYTVGGDRPLLVKQSDPSGAAPGPEGHGYRDGTAEYRMLISRRGSPTWCEISGSIRWYGRSPRLSVAAAVA